MIRYFQKRVNCISPTEEEYTIIRKLIECIKRNQQTASVIDESIDFISKRNTKEVILGCTEFSAFIDYCYSAGTELHKSIIK